ncbi:uncharacterized protein LOC111632085 isoform X1 [Centruroides sculpturatus]|uniref:uncharacterized protein LOC111632085 isoform X1 n=1 Tax=Centruroides sculpturatus TaxID=218467 RepID=UPI000C6E2254|nr:uncharacterized protein LOC111632085 isoform X1 [Centruroides sculpturatus]
MNLNIFHFLFLFSLFITEESCKIFVDLTTNRLSRVQDGTVGLWSFHGKAKESHAIKTTFTYNADLIDEQSFYNGSIKHINLATITEPYLGLTSDTDDDYLDYLLLQAHTANIDGFILEWGYEGHPSNLALHRLLNVLKKPKFSNTKFCIGINWCDHWLKQKLKNSSEMIEIFHKNAQYLLDSFFIPFFNISHKYHHHPIIMLFGGGITSDEFLEVLKRKFFVPANMDQPIWIGNYLNTASTVKLRNQWLKLLNGTFAWVSHSHLTPPWLNDWDTYSLPGDTVIYQKEVRDLSIKLVANKTWNYWMASANPGEDNRGCAGWGQMLKYVPRIWNNVSHCNTSNCQIWFFCIDINIKV